MHLKNIVTPMIRSRADRSSNRHRNKEMAIRLTIGTTAAAVVIFACWLPQAAGQNSAQVAGGSAVRTPPNLSGFWELHFDSRNVPPASLTAALAAEDKDLQFKKDMTEIRWCHFPGVPYVMEDSPIDILQNRNGKEVIIASSLRSPARHIYTDGRGHVNPETFDPVSNGHSIGHWDGEALVVDTVGFSNEGITRIPGGGRRTTDSHLIERFRLVEGGNRLSVTFTWEDPKVFAKPHSYEFRYYRSPKNAEAREFDCNANDEDRAKFLLGMPGK
jgi:hypothetical protein